MLVRLLRRLRLEPVPTSKVQVSWTQFVVSRRQLAAKYLSRLRGRDPDLSVSEQTVAIELTLLSDSPQKDQSLERLKQLLKNTPGLGSVIRREIGILSGDRSAVAIRRRGLFVNYDKTAARW